MPMTDPTPQPALGRPDRSPWLRRLVMPAAIIAMAGVVLVISRQREAARTEEVRQIVERICLEIDRHRHDPDRPLDPALETILGPGLRGTIAAALPDGRLDPASLTITVIGDDWPPPAGDGRATHRALIEFNGQRGIALRILHPGRADGISVLGYLASDERGDFPPASP